MTLSTLSTNIQVNLNNQYTDQNNFLNKSRLNILFIVFYGSFEALNKQIFWLNETF